MKTTKQTRREATQLFRACIVDGLLHEERALEMVQQTLAAKPRGYLGTLSYFRLLVRLDHAQHIANVESAMPLSADQRASVKTGLAQVYGPGLNSFFAENPGLIGGMRIQVGSDVYDGSVRSRLAALQQSF